MVTTKAEQKRHYWPTAKAYEALGLPVPDDVAATDGECGDDDRAES